MIRRKFTLVTFLGLSLFLSCKSPTNSKFIEEKSIRKTQENSEVISKITVPTSARQTQVNLKADKFLKNLEHSEKLNSFFTENWTLIYHKDDRCAGSTDGQINDLTNTQIDSIIRLHVRNDGNGWACDKKEPKIYYFDFDLRQLIKKWDKFQITNYENQDDSIIYVVGAGETDYLKIYYNDIKLIYRLEYRSEDPG